MAMRRAKILLAAAAAVLSPGEDYRRFEHTQVRSGHGNADLLLCHDPRLKFETAKLAIGIHSGSFSDPVEGAAHFFEHSAFLGSQTFHIPVEKDQEEEEQEEEDQEEEDQPSSSQRRNAEESSRRSPSEFDHFLADVGGSTNAATFPNQTVFTSIVPFAELEGALSRMLDMIEHPCLDVEDTSREITAVDAEHRKNVKDIGHKVWQVIMSFFEPPYNHFSTGNENTLRLTPSGIAGERNLCVKGNSTPSLPNAVAALRQYYEEKVDGCNIVVLAFSDMSLNQLENKVVPVVRSALRECKPKANDDSSQSLPDTALHRDREALLPLPIPSQLVSVVDVISYAPSLNEHPEIMELLAFLAKTQLGKLLLDSLRDADVAVSDCVCSANAIDIEPLRFLSIDCKFLCDVAPTPGALDQLIVYTKGAVVQLWNYLRTEAEKGKLEVLLEHIHDLHQMNRAISPTPKMDSTGTLVEFTKLFMAHARMEDTSPKFAGLVKFLEGNSEVSLTSLELKEVLDQIIAANHVTLLSGSDSVLSDLEDDITYLTHYNQHYKMKYYEMQHPRQSSPRVSMSNLDLVGASCGPLAEVVSRKRAKKATKRADVWYIAPLRPVSAFKLHLDTPQRDLSSLNVALYLWGLLMADDFEKQHSSEFENCLTKASVSSGVKLGRVTLDLKGPRTDGRLLRRYLEFVEDHLTRAQQAESDKDAPHLRAHLISLVMKDVVTNHPVGFKRLYERLLDELDTARFNLSSKMEALDLLEGMDVLKEIQLATRALTVSGLVTDEEVELERLAEFSNHHPIPLRHFTQPKKSLVINMKDEYPSEPPWPPVHKQVQFSLESLNLQHAFDICAPQQQEVRPDLPHDSPDGTQMLQFVTLPVYQPPHSQFVKLYSDKSWIVMNWLLGKCVAQNLSTHLFDVLRNEQHIGYIIDASFWPGDRKMNGILIRIQAPRLTPAELLSLLETELRKFEASCSSEELKQALAEFLNDSDDPMKTFENQHTWIDMGMPPDNDYNRHIEEIVASGFWDHQKVMSGILAAALTSDAAIKITIFG